MVIDKCNACGTPVSSIARDHIRITADLDSITPDNELSAICIECVKSIHAAAEILNWKLSKEECIIGDLN